MTIALAPACGGGSSEPDAREVPDAPTAVHHRYVADAIRLPTTTTEAQAFAMGIDSPPIGDEAVDNQLGGAFAALHAIGFDIQIATTAAVDDGHIIQLADYLTTSFASASTSTLTLYLGTNPNPMPCLDVNDPVCRQHLDGAASFSVDPASPANAVVIGPVVDSAFTSPIGVATLTLTIALNPDSPFQVHLIGARSELRGVSATGIVDGKIAGAVPKTDVDNNLVPSMQSLIGTALIADGLSATPPACTCTPSSTGESAMNEFDTNHDCSVTVDEVRSAPILAGFLTPDITIDGVDAVSLGVGFSAVSARFSP